MARIEARVRDGALSVEEGGAARVFAVGSGEWDRWLASQDTVAFRFEHDAGVFTARCETHRGRRYWYAYRRLAGRLRKIYLGRASDLTLDRLETAAARLAESMDGAGQRTQPAPPDVRHNLPAEISSFVGRESEVASVRQAAGASRLVTLTGPGGVGKTRLALRAASELLDGLVDAVWLVDLEALSDPARVLAAIVQAVGVREAPGQPLLAPLAASLGVGRPLLLLDTCEHVVGACADVSERLLRSCPGLRILATSREPLGTPGERIWRVPPLGLPEDDDALHRDRLAQSEAARLFVERAQAVRLDFALTASNAPAVATICRRLDGIPLAIELAAAQMRVMSPEELASSQDDRFRLLGGGRGAALPRQQTLGAAIGWSYDLLDEPERRLFERVSVFAGGFVGEAAEQVCGVDPLASADVFARLTRLVDRSLVVAESGPGQEPTRYRLLETLRTFAGARLAARGEAEAARARHAAWLVERAEQAARAYHGPEQGRWLRWAEREHGNAQAALAWALGGGEPDMAVRLAAAFSWPWLVHGRWSEGLDWAQRALALPSAAPTRERGRLIAGAIQLTLFRGDLTSNRPSGDLDTASRLTEECFAIGETLGDDWLILAGQGIADLLREFGAEVTNVPASSPESGLAAARRLGEAWPVARALEAVAREALRDGDVAAAGARLREAIALARADGDGWSLAMALNELGDIERSRGGHARARPLYEESRSTFATLGLGDQPHLDHNLGYVALASGDREGAAASFRRAMARFRRLGERRGLAECAIGCGAVAVAERRLVDGGRLFGAGEAALEALGTHLWPANRFDHERWLARARSSRASAEFERALAEGRALPLDDVTAWILDGRPLGVVAVLVPAPTTGLTPREREVAVLAAQGLSNHQIARVLTIAEKTVANHVQRALEKLDVRTRVQLAARAGEFGLLGDERGGN